MLFKREMNVESWLLLLSGFLIPFEERLISILTILLLIRTISKVGIRSLFIFSKQKRSYVIIFMLLYFMQIPGLFYTENIPNGIFVLEKTLSILVYPLIFAHLQITKEVIRKVLISFVSGCTFAAVLCLANALYTNYCTNHLSIVLTKLYETNMPNFLGLSHVYLGMYISFSILILVALLFEKKRSIKIQCLLLFSLLFLLNFLVLLGAKMALLSLFFVLFVNIAFYTVTGEKKIFGVGLLVSAILIAFIGICFFPETKNRFSMLFQKENYQEGDNAWNSIAVRTSTFKCSIESITNNFWFGVGTGDAENELNKCYSINHYNSLINYNPHNQYLQYLLTYGIFGLLFYLICLLLPLVLAFKKKQILFMGFILLILFSGLTESILTVNKGIVFYSFFNSFLFFGYIMTTIEVDSKKDIRARVQDV